MAPSADYARDEMKLADSLRIESDTTHVRNAVRARPWRHFIECSTPQGGSNTLLSTLALARPVCVACQRRRGFTSHQQGTGANGSGATDRDGAQSRPEPD